MAKGQPENYRFLQLYCIGYHNVNYVNKHFQVCFLLLICIFIDYVKDYNKRIDIFKLNRPTDGHYMVLEVVGMPGGKTF